MKVKGKWYVYMLECSDHTIYTGITKDLDVRVAAHNSGKGAKYTRGRTPVTLKAEWEFGSRSEASEIEYALKKLSKEQKLECIRSGKLP